MSRRDPDAPDLATPEDRAIYNAYLADLREQRDERVLAEIRALRADADRFALAGDMLAAALQDSRASTLAAGLYPRGSR